MKYKKNDYYKRTGKHSIGGWIEQQLNNIIQPEIITVYIIVRTQYNLFTSVLRY